MTFPHDAAEWEIWLQVMWVLITPFALTLAAIILATRLVKAERWRSRMSRASFFLIGSYALLMDRLLLGRFNPGVQDAQNYPQPLYAAFYLAAAAYFLYALIREWVFPFVYYAVHIMQGRRTTKPVMRKEIDDA